MEERPKWRTLAPRKETVVISHLILDTVDSKADGIIEGEYRLLGCIHQD